MKKVAIFMSDFHLGQKNRMEEFHTSDEFAELLGRLSLSHVDDAVDLVLLGDVMDLWTTITNPKEERAETIKDIDLYLPVWSQPDIPVAEDKEADKVHAVLENHPMFFEALGRFLVREPKRRRIIYVPGNHDHSMTSKRLQRLVVESILAPSVMSFSRLHNPATTKAGLARRIKFPSYYKSEFLQVYAEHGNQLTYGGVFRYDDDKFKSTFHQFGSECPGYVQFKTVSSRVERCAPKLNGLLMGMFNPANWPGLAGWLLFRGYFRALIYLQRFRIQYMENPDHNDRIKWAHDELPAEWKTILYLLKSRLFSVTHDEFGDLLPKLFELGSDPLAIPLSGQPLDPRKIKTVVLGHSHQSRDIDVPGFDGLKYYNTGSWILRQENQREIVEQIWVTVRRELPDNVGAIDTTRPDAMIMVVDRFKRATWLTLATHELCEGVVVGDQVLIERNERGLVSGVLRDKALRRQVIDRQMTRRRVELARVADSPATTDGKPLNDVLESMDLRIGDLMLFHWNFGKYLRRIARTQPTKFLRVIPGVVTGAINRLGTSSYWNHIAMLYGTPSERQESDYYNDPLIIEALPDTGVGIHTPRHYVEYPKEWDFAVLRLKDSLLNRWEARRLLRRLTLGYLGAEYDRETVARGTIAYAALTMDAKGRSALGGAVYGAILGVAISTGVLLWQTAQYLLDHGFAWIPAEWWEHGKDGWSAAVAGFSHWEADIVAVLFQLLVIFASLLAAMIAVYVLGNLLRLAVMTWISITGAIGAAAGLCIVPVMSDIADGWMQKSVAKRRGFVAIWFSPLLLLFLATPIAEWLGAEEWKAVAKVYIILVLTAALVTVLLAGTVNRAAEPFINWLGHCADRIKQSLSRLYATLGWPTPQPSTCSAPRLQRQFICSGLVQEALVETARELEPGHVANVVVHPDWSPAQSLPDQSCTLRSTMPKHFALSDSFKWTYLYLDQVLTANPSPSQKAQAYSAPVRSMRPHLCRPAVRAIKCGFTGVFLTIFATIASGKFAQLLVSRNWIPYVPSDLSGQHVKTTFLLPAIALGITAIFFAKKAQKELALSPQHRGRALAIYGFISGGIAVAFGLGNVLMASNVVVGIIATVLCAALGSAILLLF